MESSNSYTSSIRDKRNCRTLYVEWKEGNICCIMAIQIGLSGGQIPWNAIAICETSMTSWQTGNLKMNEDLGNHSKDQVYHLAHWLDISQTPRETKQEIINLERKFYHGSFPRICFDRGGIWKGDILIADIEELGNMNASEIYPRRLNAKEVLITKKTENLYFLWQMVQQNYQEETTNSKNPLWDGNPP